MKKIFVIFILLLFAQQCSAEKFQLPAQTATVKQIEYIDVQNIHQGEQATKQLVTIEINKGEFKGTQKVLENMLTGNPAYDIPLKKGDRVILHAESDSENITDIDEIDFFIADIQRSNQILFFGGIFALLLLVIGRAKGIRGIIAIISTILLIFFVMTPVILAGFSSICAAIITGILSTIITLYLVGGFNYKSSSAILGTSVSLLFAGIVSLVAIEVAHLTGFAGEENMFLYATRPDLSFSGILAASMIIAALGALMDTAVSIASTINEIYETDSSLSVKELFKSGMNVGRDIIGTMSNTLILVYLGSSIPLVLLSGNIDINKFFNLNQVATEILSALTGSIAILVCVPLTAIIAAILIKKRHTDIELDSLD